MLDPMFHFRRTIEFDDLDKFFDAVRDRRSKLERPCVKFAVDMYNCDCPPLEMARLTGTLLEFKVKAEATTDNESLELKMPCGEFRGSIDVPPPAPAERSAVVERLHKKCEELNLELLPMG